MCSRDTPIAKTDATTRAALNSLLHFAKHPLTTFISSAERNWQSVTTTVIMTRFVGGAAPTPARPDV
jgi:hypothetical protein